MEERADQKDGSLDIEGRLGAIDEESSVEF